MVFKCNFQKDSKDSKDSKDLFSPMTLLKMYGGKVQIHIFTNNLHESTGFLCGTLLQHHFEK